MSHNLVSNLKPSYQVWRHVMCLARAFENLVPVDKTPESYFFIICFILYAWVFCLNVYLCTTRIPGVLRGQQRASDPPPPTLNVENGWEHSCIAENQTWVLCKNKALPTEPLLQLGELFYTQALQHLCYFLPSPKTGAPRITLSHSTIPLLALFIPEKLSEKKTHDFVRLPCYIKHSTSCNSRS